VDYKKCGKCGRTLPTSDFHVRRRKGCRDSLQSWCKACQLERHNAWKEKNRERYLASRRRRRRDRLEAGSQEVRRQILCKYGLTLEQYSEMLAKQGGCCAICGLPERARNQHGQLSLSVDHSHTSGRVRGLLCRSCNTILGMAKENAGVLERAIDYIVRDVAEDNRAYWAAEEARAHA
jgi:hypothetical protein